MKIRKSIWFQVFQSMADSFVYDDIKIKNNSSKYDLGE